MTNEKHGTETQLLEQFSSIEKMVAELKKASEILHGNYEEFGASLQMLRRDGKYFLRVFGWRDGGVFDIETELHSQPIQSAEEFVSKTIFSQAIFLAMLSATLKNNDYEFAGDAILSSWKKDSDTAKNKRRNSTEKTA